MFDLVVVGIATLDITNKIEIYPPEDTKTRIQETNHKRGGNGTNVLVIASQLGLTCSWIGTIADESKDFNARIIINDLLSHNIDITKAVKCISDAKTPTSYIFLSEETGSRTIFHNRNDLPELAADEFFASCVNISSKWIHFECRNIGELSQMLECLSEASNCLHTSVRSLEIESTRYPWDQVSNLLPNLDYVFISKDYVLHQGYSNAEGMIHYLASIQRSKKLIVVCPWGNKGAYGCILETDSYGRSNLEVIHVDAYISDDKRVVDTLGAGDTFIGAFITSQIKQNSLLESMKFACFVSGEKCTHEGLNFSNDSLNKFQS